MLVVAAAAVQPDCDDVAVDDDRLIANVIEIGVRLAGLVVDIVDVAMFVAAAAAEEAVIARV